MPKACDDFISAQKSFISLNYPALISRTNIIAMNYLNNYMYAFSNDGDFYEFEVDIDKKSIKYSAKKNMEEFLN